MLAWIEFRFPRPIYLAVLVVSLYFLMWVPGWLTWSLFIFLLWRVWRQYDRARCLRTGILLICFAIFFTYHQWHWQIRKQNHPHQAHQLVVEMDSIKVNGDSLSFRGRAEGYRYQVYYQLSSEAAQHYFQTLAQPVRLTVLAEMETPEGQRNFNGFDYAAYLRSQGIYRTLKINEISAITPFSSLHPILLLKLWRRKALVWTHQRFPAPLRHYLAGLLFGALDVDFSEMNDIYSNLGIIHLFALSGMHVAFFMNKASYLLLRLGLKRETVWWCNLPLAFIYAGLTGFSISVIRSLIQRSLAEKGIRKLDNLALTLGLCFLCVPHFLQTRGGVLSFTYALVLSVLSMAELPRIKRGIVESTALALGVLPVLSFYFSSFQPLSIPLTFIFSLVFDLLVLPLLTLVFLLSPWVVFQPVNDVFIFLENLMNWLAQLSPAPLVVGRPSPWLFFALLVVLALLHDFWKQQTRRYICLLVLTGLFFLCKHPLVNEVTVVDIGQGDSIFLRDMGGRTILIDVGGKVDFGQKAAWRQKVTQPNAVRTLIPYLKSRGVGRIDQLVLTHTDTDHIGDMEAVAQAFAIGEILVSQGSLTNESFVQRLKALKVKVRAVTAGDRLPIMGSQLQVLYPWEVGDGGNNDSLVLYGRLLDKHFLFTGDLEDGELALIQRYPHLPVDVLKAGHHGSKESSYPEFLAHIQAEVALISAGKNNRYQHPHEETLARFTQAGLAVYRTDQQGAIRFSGWRQWQIETVK